jgi:nitrous oxide reductase accessory protein NosL
MKRQAIALYFLVMLLTTPMASAGERQPVKPTAKDKCPVCGMFVAKYPDFAAQVIFKDGSYAFFDGAKDMFKYYFNLTKYNRSQTVAEIDSVYVTDYYDLEWIDGYKAFYVAGSDVYGPMGREIIPFEKKAGAEQFLIDHLGKSLLTFEQITHDLIKKLD